MADPLLPGAAVRGTHAGADRGSYPYDGTSNSKNEYCGTPDDDIFRTLALAYAKSHKTMSLNARVCAIDRLRTQLSRCSRAAGRRSTRALQTAPTGTACTVACRCELRLLMRFILTWRQDYNYLHSNCFEITVELSCCKYPAASTLQTEWNNNKEALLVYAEQVHVAIKGMVTDIRSGAVIPNALVSGQLPRPCMMVSEQCACSEGPGPQCAQW